MAGARRPGPLTPLRVLDRYADGTGSTEGRLLGRWTLFRSADRNTVVRFDLPPERPEVHARIDERGALVSVRALRWGNPGRQPFGYLPFGCEVLAERSFGALTIPSRLSVGWWFATPRYAPFFKADPGPPAGRNQGSTDRAARRSLVPSASG